VREIVLGPVKAGADAVAESELERMHVKNW
jgi:hypothetical protein